MKKKIIGGLLLSTVLFSYASSVSKEAEAVEAKQVAKPTEVVEPAPVAKATPAAEVQVAETEPTILIYVKVYLDGEIFIIGHRPIVAKKGEDLIAVARSRYGEGEYETFLRGEVEYLNEEGAVVRLYFSKVPPTTETPKSTEQPKTEEPKTTPPTTEAPTTEAPTTTQEPKKPAPKVEEPKVQAAAPVYRLYQPDLKVHLYTKDTNEYKVLATRGWKQEGISWRTEVQKGDAVYRLYHPGLRVHLYTKDANEYKVLATRGWKQEGVAYCSFGSVPVYRLYHAGLRKHLYTKDANEYKVLATRGWKQEGVAWYSQP